MAYFIVGSRALGRANAGRGKGALWPPNAVCGIRSRLGGYVSKARHAALLVSARAFVN
jgi:hypothetical protein